MRSYRLFLVALVFSALATSPSVWADEVQWRHDYNAARREANEKGRPLVLDFGTEACVWCKRLDATTFRDPAVARLLNERFVPLKIDGDKDAPLAQALQIQTYPTLVFAAADGKILGRHEGYIEAPRFRDAAQRVLSDVTSQVDDKAQQRLRQAREVLALAREDYRTRQYLTCLDRCDHLAAHYADLPEAVEALQIAAEIKGNTDWVVKTCEQLGDRLGMLYLALADSCLKRGQPQQAAVYLERVTRAFPGSRHAEIAQLRLAQVRGDTNP